MEEYDVISFLVDFLISKNKRDLYAAYGAAVEITNKFGRETPDWVRMFALADPGHLEEAADESLRSLVFEVPHD